MKTATLTAFLALAAVFSLPLIVGPAVAQDAGALIGESATAVLPAVASGDPIDIAGELIRAARTGNWSLVAAGLLSLTMVLAYRMKVRTWRVFRGDRGGVILLVAMALAGAFATALYAGAPFGVDLILGAFKEAIMAAGGFQILKRIIWPKDGAPAAAPTTES